MTPHDILARRLRGWTALFFCAVLAAAFWGPGAAFAQDAPKTVRVGWYDSTYCYYDSLGRRNGIAYEYQQKIAAYTGWDYEYVEGSWPDLLQMLIDGEIDLLSDVSYTEERAEKMLFSAFAMGSESYYIYVDINNREIGMEDLSSFNGKRIGVNKESVLEDFLIAWAQENHLSPEIIPMTDSIDAAIHRMSQGEIDAYATLDSYGAAQNCLPVCKVGVSAYYFSVNKARPDLLNALNEAMSAIFDEDAFYNQKIYEKYMQLATMNAFLTPGIAQWLSGHGTIRVGYLEDFLPFSDKDGETGELTGALNDYLAHASNCIRNAEISFKTLGYATIEDALNALTAGEVDCVFPVNLGLYDSEIRDVLITNSAVQTGMYILTRPGNEGTALSDRAMTVALDQKNTNYEEFLKDNFPGWKPVYYPTVRERLRAMAAGEADCTLVDSYRINALEGTGTQYSLVFLPTGATMPLSFAVRRADQALYSLLNKVVSLTPGEEVNAYLTAYANPGTRTTVMQFLREHWLEVILLLTVFFAVVLILLLLKLKADRKVIEQQKQIASTQDMAFKDPLTGVKSKHAYVNAENKMDQRIADGTVTAFSVGVFDLNDLKKVNDTQGHDAGDQYIRESCNLICKCFQHSPVYRIGGDEFAVILEGQDYDMQDEMLKAFDQQMEENLAQGKIVVSSGISRYQPGQDKSIRTVFGRADEKMYERKRYLKEKRDCGR